MKKASIAYAGYITEYYLSDSLPKVESIKLSSQLKTIDAMHFGWNIGKAFGKPRLQTATFIKRVFAHTLRDVEISTIERKMSHTESECKIKLDKNVCLTYLPIISFSSSILSLPLCNMAMTIGAYRPQIIARDFFHAFY